MALEPSRKVAELAPSATEEMDNEVKRLRREGAEDLLSLAVGEPCFDTPDFIKSAACDALMAGKTKYQPTAGDFALREAVSAKLSAENGIQAPPETVVVSGTVQDIVPSPSFAADNTLLATIGGDICRSTDGGKTWQRLRGGLPDLGPYPLAVQAVFSPAYAEDQTLYYSAYLAETHGEGVYRSTDGGETWQHTSDGLLDLRVHRIVPSPRFREDGTLLAYAHIQQGSALYRSTNRGETWELVVRQTSYGIPPVPSPEEMFVSRTPLPRFRCHR